jgi:hypothetical protein
MSDSIASLLQRILGLLQGVLPDWAVASVVVGLCVLATLAAIAHARRLSPSITVTVDNSNKIETAEIRVRAADRSRTRNGSGCWYAELRRIASLESDDDEELWIS